MVIHTAPAKAEAPADLKDRLARESVADGVRQYFDILPTSDPKAVAALLALWRATHAQYVSNCRAVDALGLPIAVTGKRLAILRILYFTPEKQMTLGALCKAVNLSPAAVTNYVDSLSRGSLVRRICSPEDRRVNIVQLTTRGETAFIGIAGALAQSWTEASACFSDEEKEILIRLLKRLAA